MKTKATSIENLKRPECGVFNYDFPTYRAIQAFSASLLDKLHDASPAHVLDYIQNRPEPTPALEIGTAIHLKCLEPQLFDGNVDIVKSRPSDKSKRPPGRTLIREAEMPVINGVAESMEICRIKIDGQVMTPAELISRSKIETTMIWRDKETDSLCKIRTDLIYKNSIVDIKSTADMSAFDVPAREASAFKCGYHRRAAFYMEGYSQCIEPIDNYYFLVVEKYAPFGWRLFKAGPDFLNLGRQQFRQYLNVLAECFKTNNWPYYEPETTDLCLPPWVKI